MLQQPAALGMGFIVKYSPVGNVLWSAKVQGAGSGEAKMMSCTTGGDDVYAVATYKSQVSVFNADGSLFRALSPPGTNDNAMLIKYAGQSGQVQWIITLDHATGNEYMTAVKTDGYGNVYVSGYHSLTSVQFKGAYPGGYNLTVQTSANDGFLARYRSSGEFVWVMTFGSVGVDRAEAIDVDSSGNIYLGASSVSSVSSSNVVWRNATGDPWKTYPITSDYDIFITRISPTGNYAWMARIFSLSGSDFVKGLAVSRDGGLYVTGYVESSTADTINFHHANEIHNAPHTFFCALQFSKWCISMGYEAV